MEDHKATLLSQQKKLDRSLQQYGENNVLTADSYHSIGVTQHELKDYDAALQSKQKALNIRLKLYGEDHSSTADSSYSIGHTQYMMKDYQSALQSEHKALDIRLKLYGEDHSSTAASYYSIGRTQYEMKDYKSALQSKQKALDIRLKLYGEDHSSTADTYYNIGVTQYMMEDYKSALQSHQKALDIRLKLYGEDHSSTADSYDNTGLTQYMMEDYKSALQSHQKALHIRLKLYGEDHSSTADSYHTIGVTQYRMKDYRSALQSQQKALDIRLKLYGEDHPSTAASYYGIEITQQKMKDYKSSFQSKQKIRDIRLKLYGEDHSSTADSGSSIADSGYGSIGVEQHEVEDYKSALQSKHKALDITLKLHVELDHPLTTDTYRSIGVTQPMMKIYESRCRINKVGGGISLPSAGAFFYFPANAVSRPTTVTCALVMQKNNPLELKSGEYFCSSIVSIKTAETTFAKPVTVLLSHSVAVQGPYLDYYDVTMMQCGQQWNNLETKHCIKFEDLPENSASRFPAIHDYLPVAMATVQANCTAAVVTRIRSEKILVHPEKPCVFLKSYGKESTLKISFPACSVEMECCLSVKLFPACEILDMHSRSNEEKKEEEEEDKKEEDDEDEDKSEKEEEEMEDDEDEDEDEDEDLVYFPVIEVSGHKTAFLKHIDVELVYSHNDVAELDDELLPVGKKEPFSPEYGVLFCSQKSDQSNQTWRTEDTNATIERLENDRVRIAFSAEHFSRWFFIRRRRRRAAVPDIKMTETFGEPSSTNFVVFILAVQQTTFLTSIMAPQNKRSEVEKEWGFKGEVCQEYVKPNQKTYFCVHLLPKKKRLSLITDTICFKVEHVTKTENDIDEGLDLKGKLIYFLSSRCKKKKHKKTFLQNIRIKSANDRQTESVVTEDLHEPDEAPIFPAVKSEEEEVSSGDVPDELKDEEIVLIARRIPEQWKEIALLTKLFESHEITNMACSRFDEDQSSKALTMLMQFNERDGSRKQLVEALRKVEQHSLAQKVKSGFFMQSQ